MRIVALLVALFIFSVSFMDVASFRPMTSEMEAYSVHVKTKKVTSLPLESQELINDQSLNKFAKKSLSTIFNYRPGQAEQHIDSEEIKSLFISEKFFNEFREQFLQYSNGEFRVNNISIKESVAIDAKMIGTPRIGNGARVWQMSADLPMLNRAVGKNQLENLLVTVKLVYLGPEGGMGVYGIRLYRN